MAILEELIAPLSIREFNDNYLFKVPYAAPFKAARFENLLSWDLLAEIFSVKHPDCWLPKEGMLPAEPNLATGQLTLEQAKRGFQEGRTVLVRHSEVAHPKLAEVAQDFSDLFQDPVDIQLYCTPAEEEGFNWHYDVEEVFVIQSVGEKEFRLRRNTLNPWPLIRDLPQNMKFENERPTPEIRCHLKAGDWLYIPSGYWHKARAITESFHLSVGVSALTAIEYIESFLPQLATNIFWRQRLPLRGREEVETLQTLQQLTESIKNLIEDEKRFKKLVRKPKRTEKHGNENSHRTLSP